MTRKKSRIYIIASLGFSTRVQVDRYDKIKRVHEGLEPWKYKKFSELIKYITKIYGKPILFDLTNYVKNSSSERTGQKWYPPEENFSGLMTKVK
jgi:hypothetical protein